MSERGNLSKRHSRMSDTPDTPDTTNIAGIPDVTVANLSVRLPPLFPLHVVVMGVAGCGKSVVGQRIAQQLALPLIEGDAFHPPSNVEKMRQGVPLTDDDAAS